MALQPDIWMTLEQWKADNYRWNHRPHWQLDQFSADSGQHQWSDRSGAVKLHFLAVLDDCDQRHCFVELDRSHQRVSVKRKKFKKWLKKRVKQILREQKKVWRRAST